MIIDREAWQRVLEFDIENVRSEYGFATRLAKENFWTKDFTQRAIMEYRKFMFLAANADLMVSPSPVVDEVWHEHLTFTQSYHDFCSLLGKQIQHIPSTRDRHDFEKFRLAKERTGKLYAQAFGEAPKDIWEFGGMYESLGLPKARMKIRAAVIIGILAFVVLLIPAFFVLQPIYTQIPGMSFVVGWMVLVLLSILLLELFNNSYLSKLIEASDWASFIFRLHPLEVIYAKTQQLAHVVTGVLHQLLQSKKVALQQDGGYVGQEPSKAECAEEYSVLAMLEQWPGTRYNALVRLLQNKPAIQNVGDCVDAIQKYVVKSKKFATLFYTNLAVLLFVYLLGIARLLIGMSRGRPVEVIGVVLIIFLVIIINHLRRLPGRVLTHAVAGYYEGKIERSELAKQDVQWQYFLLGTAALSPLLAAEARQFDRELYGTGSGSSSGDSSSGDSSCGSSCSSCGRCGGD